MSKKRKIPIWIYLFGAISIVTSIVGIYGGYIDGSFFYSEFPEIAWKNNLVKHLAGMWASKNLAIVIIMLYAFLKKDMKSLAFIFLFKFISDTPDILFVNTTYREGVSASWTTNIVSWLILALPSLLSFIHLNKSKSFSDE